MTSAGKATRHDEIPEKSGILLIFYAHWLSLIQQPSKWLLCDQRTEENRSLAFAIGEDHFGGHQHRLVASELGGVLTIL